MHERHIDVRDRTAYLCRLLLPDESQGSSNCGLNTRIGQLHNVQFRKEKCGGGFVGVRGKLPWSSWKTKSKESYFCFAYEHISLYHYELVLSISLGYSSRLCMAGKNFYPMATIPCSTWACHSRLHQLLVHLESLAGQIRRVEHQTACPAR